MLQAQIDTLEKMFKFVTKIHTTKKCLGTREILSEEDELQDNGRVFKKYKMGEYKWRNFIETEMQASCFGRGIVEVGVKPRDKIVLFAETRAEWMIAAHGLFKQSCTVVTIYATLGEDGITHGVNETEVNVIITSHELMPKLRSILKTIPKVDTIIYFEDPLHKTDTSGFGSLKIIPFSEVCKKGVDSKAGKTLTSIINEIVLTRQFLHRGCSTFQRWYRNYYVHIRLNWNTEGCFAIPQQLYRHNEELLWCCESANPSRLVQSLNFPYDCRSIFTPTTFSLDSCLWLTCLNFSPKVFAC